jgi:hypothetical protein
MMKAMHPSHPQAKAHACLACWLAWWADGCGRQNEVAYSHKIGDCPLSSIAVQVRKE